MAIFDRRAARIAPSSTGGSVMMTKDDARRTTYTPSFLAVLVPTQLLALLFLLSAPRGECLFSSEKLKGNQSTAFCGLLTGDSVLQLRCCTLTRVPNPTCRCKSFGTSSRAN